MNPGFIGTLVLVTLCPGALADDTAPAAPMPPAYIVLGSEAEGARLEAGRDGRQLFRNRCGHCHLEFGMGTNMLVPQQLARGEDPSTAMLESRRDLEPDYIRTVVRNGRIAMPRLSRVEVTDPELDAIIGYLARGAE